MEDPLAFAKVLARTSPLSLDDVEDLRAAFDCFLHASQSRANGFVTAKQVARILRKFGFPGVELTENGGIVVQDPSKPKLLLNEQEFLLTAARLAKYETRELLDGELDMPEEKVAQLRAARLFRSMDPNGTGEVPCEVLKIALMNLGCAPPELDAVGDLTDLWSDLDRYFDEPDDAPRYMTFDEFLDVAIQLILPTIPARAVTYSTTTGASGG
ncbi:Troponin C, slow skeletal and cardiac muscles [Hondaea fermentalgiana]|uniref:Troponin C, slow skeletal and cardiac muscles n=1 Tax=Hondaea fermentalgiana TaxID=2315210 RepID=A0A2R5GAW1_9STRA|nr:Troponin C, slow skeletal and cardiac muscles [Hondaea fermentalgiana]|eukprot:GBG25231.1 Troponin C, slow skeletal and cardiac muscles [Hondaea fermentalgiana]